MSSAQLNESPSESVVDIPPVRAPIAPGMTARGNVRRAEDGVLESSNLPEQEDDARRGRSSSKTRAKDAGVFPKSKWARGVLFVLLVLFGFLVKSAFWPKTAVKPAYVLTTPAPPPITPITSSPVFSPNHVWDQVAYPEDAQDQCGWFKPQWSSDVSYCLRTNNDAVSMIMRQTGYWADCEILVTLLEKKKLTPDAMFVDVGANIGACTARVAFLRNVHVFAYEPEPHNLFYLTNTLAKNKFDNVVLYTAGASSAPGVNVIYSENGNAGNSVVGVAHPDFPDPNTVEAMSKRKSSIALVTLDDSLWPDPTQAAPKIVLMKMDVQGFEVNALRGAKRLLAACAIEQIKFEVSFSHLVAQGTSGAELCALLVNAGFDLTDEKGAPWTEAQCGPGNRGYPDVIATLDADRCAKQAKA